MEFNSILERRLSAAGCGTARHGEARQGFLNQKRGEIMKISRDVIDGIVEDTKDMLLYNHESIELAYIAAGDDPLGIAIKVTIKPDEAKLKVLTTINFVTDRCKDERRRYIDPEQTNLFDQDGGAGAGG